MLPTPPPPPPPIIKNPPPQAPNPPVIPPKGPPGALLIELLIYNGSPFMDHWAYWLGTRSNPDIGVLINAAGTPRTGFRFEVERSHDFRTTSNRPWKRIPLQWIDAKHLDEDAMFNYGDLKVDSAPVCGLEASAYKVKAPEKSLNTVDDQDELEGNIGKRITQRNCQTWIVESADQLVQDGIFREEVAAYLHATRQ